MPRRGVYRAVTLGASGNAAAAPACCESLGGWRDRLQDLRLRQRAGGAVLWFLWRFPRVDGGVDRARDSHRCGRPDASAADGHDAGRGDRNTDRELRSGPRAGRSRRDHLPVMRPRQRARPRLLPSVCGGARSDRDRADRRGDRLQPPAGPSRAGRGSDHRRRRGRRRHRRRPVRGRDHRPRQRPGRRLVDTNRFDCRPVGLRHRICLAVRNPSRRRRRSACRHRRPGGLRSRAAPAAAETSSSARPTGRESRRFSRNRATKCRPPGRRT